jgi:hypothetical protein
MKWLKTHVPKVYYRGRRDVYHGEMFTPHVYQLGLKIVDESQMHKSNQTTFE